MARNTGAAAVTVTFLSDGEGGPFIRYVKRSLDRSFRASTKHPMEMIRNCWRIFGDEPPMELAMLILSAQPPKHHSRHRIALHDLQPRQSPRHDRSRIHLSPRGLPLRLATPYPAGRAVSPNRRRRGSGAAGRVHARPR